MSTGTVKALASKKDIIVPVAIIGIILMMILPMPAWLIDAMISLSMAISVGVFLTALFIENALEFSAFPAFVLVGTLLRLSLNVATTRLILLHGGEGNGSAGGVVEAFGRFVVEGNVVVGLVVFLILTVIAIAMFYTGQVYAIEHFHLDDIEEYLNKNLPNRWAAYKQGVHEGYEQGLRDALKGPQA